jgi:ubiquinone/menaquinone biosynthesis C-methylase UbiE
MVFEDITMSTQQSRNRSQKYYDAFSVSYEEHRDHGYHVLIDELEVELVQRYGGDRILEIGCGTGLILKRLEPLCRLAVGIDLSAGMLKVARERGLHVLQCPANTLPLPDESFDTVVSFKVLAHIPEIEATLFELSRVTRPGGHLLLEFYNRYSLRTLIKKLKNPTQIGETYDDEDVFTRFDSLSRIRTYLPRELSLIGVRGVRVFTPLAQLHDLPVVKTLLGGAERLAADAPFIRRLGGFIIVILRKQS